LLEPECVSFDCVAPVAACTVSACLRSDVNGDCLTPVQHGVWDKAGAVVRRFFAALFAPVTP
jgi:hypothetical protein